MATITPKTFDEGCAAQMLRPTDHCFYCGRKLIGFPLVYWHGNDESSQEIWLHLECAKKLAIHLQEDAA